MFILANNSIYSLETGTIHQPQLLSEEDHVACMAEGSNGEAVFATRGELKIIGRETAGYPLSLAEKTTCLAMIGHSPRTVLLGTEPARLYCWTEDRAAAAPVDAFDQLSCRDRWHTPWGGPPAVRSLAGNGDGWLYADIHVGSIMRSPDNGCSWEPVNEEINEDVHQVAGCNGRSARVYANTAKGVYISEDRGGTWHHRAADLDNRYGRAIAVSPLQPDVLMASVSDGPHGDNVHGELHVSHDCGDTWLHVKDPFPSSTKENINTFHLSFSRDGTAWAVCGKDLFRGRDKGTRWELYWTAPYPIQMLSQPPTEGRARVTKSLMSKPFG